jgi:hypothetical protein
LCALNEFDLVCYEDDITNRLEETLKLFEDLIHRFDNLRFEIVLSKKDILIEMIKKGNDFKNLKKFGFEKDISFKNIVEFHIELFTSRVKDREKLFLYNFHCANLVDLKESNELLENVLNNIIYYQKKDIVYPNIFNYVLNTKSFNFKIFFDLKFIYNKK